MKTKFSQNANFKDLLKRNQNAIVDAALNGLEATDNCKHSIFRLDTHVP